MKFENKSMWMYGKLNQKSMKNILQQSRYIHDRMGLISNGKDYVRHKQKLSFGWFALNQPDSPCMYKQLATDVKGEGQKTARDPRGRYLASLSSHENDYHGRQKEKFLI